MGKYEPYPRKTARLLRHYLPQMRVSVFRGMGHRQRCMSIRTHTAGS